MSMNTPYVQSIRFVRDTDKKVFTVTFYSHWSDIQSADGETDSVKYLGGDEKYISANKGHTYTKVRES